MNPIFSRRTMLDAKHRIGWGGELPNRQNDPIKFLYPAGGVGRPRIVIMHSWKKMGADERDGQGRDGKLNRRRVCQDPHGPLSEGRAEP